MEIKDRQQNLMTNPTENGNEIGSENFRLNYDIYDKILNNGIKMEDTSTKLDQLEN